MRKFLIVALVLFLYQGCGIMPNKTDTSFIQGNRAVTVNTSNDRFTKEFIVSAYGENIETELYSKILAFIQGASLCNSDDIRFNVNMQKLLKINTNTSFDYACGNVISESKGIVRLLSNDDNIYKISFSLPKSYSFLRKTSDYSRYILHEK